MMELFGNRTSKSCKNKSKVMWNISGKSVSHDRFMPFEPHEVLYEFDGPRIFTLVDSDGELNLVYWSDEDDIVTRYVVVPTTEKMIEGLKKGQSSVYDALNQTRSWICDILPTGEFSSCQSVVFENIPTDSLPNKSTMLLPTLEPLLTLRAVGKEIKLGMIPGSVIRSCVEGTQRALKVLAEHVLSLEQSTGKPTESLRRLFDLPTQRFAFNSFEISFRMPYEPETLLTQAGEKSDAEYNLDQVAKMLNQGLDWLSKDAAEDGLILNNNEAEAAIILQALKELSPSTQGSIDSLELSGRLLGSRVKPVTLDKNARKKVNLAIQNKKLEPKYIELEGRVGELDKDRFSFELRDLNIERPYQKFVFDVELKDDVYQAFDEEYRVKITGKKYSEKSAIVALVLSRADSNTD